VNPSELEGRFRFASGTDMLDEKNSWLSLNRKLPGNLIPAIADDAVIKWSLGKKAGDTLTYTSESGQTVRLMLIGGLANSVFQGNVIISDSLFRENYPDISGSGILLVDGPFEKQEDIETELRQVFRDYGLELTPAAQRLAEFNSVQNTYLSIFLVMGALAIMIGTAGIALFLAYSIMERQKEIALLTAVGISRSKTLRLLLNEYSLLLFSGILIGIITSAISILPSFLTPGTDVSLKPIILITAGILLNGLFWIRLMAGMYLDMPVISGSLRND